MTPLWKSYFYHMALHAAKLSKDPSTKVGCVLVDSEHLNVLSTGFNGMPRKVKDTQERYHDRETKLKLIIHAEANAIANACRSGATLHGCTAFITLPPCPQCAGLMIQAGVKKIISPPPDKDSRWYELNHLAFDILEEAEVKVEFLRP